MTKRIEEDREIVIYNQFGEEISWNPYTVEDDVLLDCEGMAENEDIEEYLNSGYYTYKYFK